MAISRISAAGANTTSVAITAAEGDLVIVFATNTNGVIPSLNADYDNIDSGITTGGGTEVSYRFAKRIAPVGGLTSTGAFTNTNRIVAIVLRGASGVGGWIIGTGNTASGAVNYPALALTGGQSGQWLIGGASRSTTSGVTTAPTDMINEGASGNSSVHSTNGIRLTDWPSTNLTLGGSSKYATYVAEILATSATPTVRQLSALGVG